MSFIESLQKADSRKKKQQNYQNILDIIVEDYRVKYTYNIRDRM